MLDHFCTNQVRRDFENYNSLQTEIFRFPAQYNISSLTPDHNHISGPNATSNNPRDWLLYPTGIIFKINAQETPKQKRAKKFGSRRLRPLLRHTLDPLLDDL